MSLAVAHSSRLLEFIPAKNTPPLKSSPTQPHVSLSLYRCVKGMYIYVVYVRLIICQYSTKPLFESEVLFLYSWSSLLHSYLLRFHSASKVATL